MKRLPLALAVTTLATTIATRAHAVDACMDTAAQRALACVQVRTHARPAHCSDQSCGDALSADVGALDASRKGGVDFRAPSLASKPKVVASTPKEPSLTEPRDDRTLRLQARQKGLLAIEARQVENLYVTTKKNAPDRVQITRRLADLYVELESAAFREKTEAETRRDRATAADADRTMKGARARAIDLYREIATDFPTHPSIDEVLYYLAYEYEQAGDLGRARAAYYDLVKKAPDSRFVPNAYLAFGELFFVEAQGDPSKWDLAAQAYAEVVKYPAPKNKVQGYARYKLAYVFWNKGELEKALDSFKKTIEHGVAHPTLPGATKLAESARRDLVPVYALKGDPAKAYGFMHGVSGDPPGSNDKTFAMLADLGASYLDTGHYPEGIVVFKDLMTRDVYYDEIDRKSEPFKANLAKPALKKCLDLSTKHQYSDAFSRSCELWLAKNYKQEYHAVDELRAAPTLGNGALAEKSPPLLAGGALFHPPPPAGPASPKPAAPPAAPTPKPAPTRGRRG